MADDPHGRALYLEEFQARVERYGVAAALAAAVETILLYRSLSSSGLARTREYMVVDVKPATSEEPATPQGDDAEPAS